MKNAMVWMVVIGIVLVFSGGVAAKQSLIDSVTKGCDKELKTLCKDVTPGAEQVLACLYEHEDKLSNKCEYAIYDAAIKLECNDDLDKFCSGMKPGEGRLLQCLDKNYAKVSKRCQQALKDTGLKK